MEIVGYVIVIAATIVIIIRQFYVKHRISRRIKDLANLYHEKNNYEIPYGKIINHNSLSKNKDFEETLADVNSYLVNNQNNTADYSIIKEIVERNAQKNEDEVDNMLSEPLYWGLMATILGAAVGILMFAWNGLGELISGQSFSADGIQQLLTHISIAMTASFIGVFCTTRLTGQYKDARNTMLKGQHRFLTWIQVNIMPKMTGELSGALTKMAQDLNHFNSTFADNTDKLQATLSMVSSSYTDQAALLQAINNLKITKIASANIDVYDKLKNCTDEIAWLGEHLRLSNDYINQVNLLNDRLGKMDERLKVFENMGKFFEAQYSTIQDLQGTTNRQMSDLHSTLNQTFQELTSGIEENSSALKQNFQKQNSSISELIDEQKESLSSMLTTQRTEVNNALTQYADPFKPLTDAIKQLSELSNKNLQDFIKATDDKLSRIEETVKKQDQQINKLLNNRAAKAPVTEKKPSAVAPKDSQQGEEQQHAEPQKTNWFNKAITSVSGLFKKKK